MKSGSIYFNVLVGPMSSGKTMFARRFWPEKARSYCNMDEIRTAALGGRTGDRDFKDAARRSWQGLETSAWEWASARSPRCFVADGLFLQRDARAAVAGIVDGVEDVVRIAWFLDTPMHTLTRRFQARVDAGEFPSVPKEVLLNQCLYFELPSPDEPFDMWIRVPVSDQNSVLSTDGADPLVVMSHRTMFSQGDRIPVCDFLDEASRVGSYRFRDLGVRR